jgi:hypothetical protein
VVVVTEVVLLDDTGTAHSEDIADPTPMPATTTNPSPATRMCGWSDQVRAHRRSRRHHPNVGVEVDHGWLWLMTDIQYLQPEYFSFMPTAPRVATSAPDEYLGGDDNG